MMYWNGDWSWWAWLTMTLMMVSFWTVVALAIWAVVRRLGQASSTSAGRTTTTPEDVLRQRYAAGELDDDELRHRLETLRDHHMDTSSHGEHRACWLERGAAGNPLTR